MLCAISICVAGAAPETSRTSLPGYAHNYKQVGRKKGLGRQQNRISLGRKLVFRGPHVQCREVCEAMNFRLLLQAGEGSWSEGKASKPLLLFLKTDSATGDGVWPVHCAPSDRHR